jgi:peptidoglycan/xylan/chitin deacetylase (PgdA/CDA1 family)
MSLSDGLDASALRRALFQQTEHVTGIPESRPGQELFVVMWTDDSQEWLLTNRPQKVVQNVVREKVSKGRGGTDRVLLLHDAHQQTVDALPEIIGHYEESGSQFTDVNELLVSKYLSEQSND